MEKYLYSESDRSLLVVRCEAFCLAECLQEGSSSVGGDSEGDSGPAAGGTAPPTLGGLPSLGGALWELVLTAFFFSVIVKIYYFISNLNAIKI